MRYNAICAWYNYIWANLSASEHWISLKHVICRSWITFFSRSRFKMWPVNRQICWFRIAYESYVSCLKCQLVKDFSKYTELNDTELNGWNSLNKSPCWICNNDKHINSSLKPAWEFFCWYIEPLISKQWWIFFKLKMEIFDILQLFFAIHVHVNILYQPAWWNSDNNLEYFSDMVVQEAFRLWIVQF